jgi:hypothetical protein
MQIWGWLIETNVEIVIIIKELIIKKCSNKSTTWRGYIN